MRLEVMTQVVFFVVFIFVASYLLAIRDEHYARKARKENAKD